MLKFSEEIQLYQKVVFNKISMYDGKKVHLDVLPFFHNKKCSKHNKNSTSKHSQYFISLIPKQGKTILTHYHLCFVNLFSLHVHFCDFFQKVFIIANNVQQVMCVLFKNEQEFTIPFKNSWRSQEFLHLIIHNCEFFERLQNL